MRIKNYDISTVYDILFFPFSAFRFFRPNPGNLVWIIKIIKNYMINIKAVSKRFDLIALKIDHTAVELHCKHSRFDKRCSGSG